MACAALGINFADDCTICSGQQNCCIFAVPVSFMGCICRVFESDDIYNELVGVGKFPHAPFLKDFLSVGVPPPHPLRAVVGNGRISCLNKGFWTHVRIKTAVSGFVGLKRTHILTKPIDLCVRFTSKIRVSRKIRHHDQ